LHLPQLGPSASLSAGTRFNVPQFGQPISMPFRSVPDPGFSSHQSMRAPETFTTRAILA
jgi:hypothetical protein